MTASADLNATAARVQAYPEPAVRDAVALLRRAVDKKLKVDTGGDRRLSGIGNARLTVTARVRGGGTFVEATVAAGGTNQGPWRWLDEGVRPYVTSAGNRHPGQAPKRTWTAPIEDTIPDAERALAARFDRTV